MVLCKQSYKISDNCCFITQLYTSIPKLAGILFIAFLEMGCMSLQPLI